jgi:hypothetical protein
VVIGDKDVGAGFAEREDANLWRVSSIGERRERGFDSWEAVR